MFDISEGGHVSGALDYGGGGGGGKAEVKVVWEMKEERVLLCP